LTKKLYIFFSFVTNSRVEFIVKSYEWDCINENIWKSGLC